MNEEDFALTIDDALSALEQGEAPAAILRRYPDVADELAPMLYAAQTLQNNQPTPSAAAERASRQRFLAAAAQRTAPATVRRPSFIMQLARVLAPAAAVIMVALGLFTVSQQSLPGDALYPLKLWSEALRGTVAGSAPADVAERRREEVRALIREGRQESVDFRGTLETVDENQWTVSGITIRINRETALPASFLEGDEVRVQGRTEQNQVVARRIEIQERAQPPSPEPQPTAEPGATVAPAEIVPPPLDDAETPTPQATPTLAPTREPDPTDEAVDDPAPIPTPEDGDDDDDDDDDGDDGYDDDGDDDSDDDSSGSGSDDDDDDDDSSGSDDDDNDDDDDDGGN